MFQEYKALCDEQLEIEIKNISEQHAHLLVDLSDARDARVYIDQNEENVDMLIRNYYDN